MIKAAVKRKFSRYDWDGVYDEPAQKAICVASAG
jgi:hypothetical protein